MLCSGCNSYCSGRKLFVDARILFSVDSLSIYADNVLIATKSANNPVLTSIRDKRNRVAEICATRDSVLISISYNSRDSSQHIPSKDTSFYIHVKEIKGFSVTINIKHEIWVLLDDVNHGYGMYEPNSK